MRLLNSIVFAIMLIAGCAPAPKDTSFTSPTGEAESAEQGIQATETYLPDIHGDEVEGAESTAGEQEMLSYNHVYWGMSFEYPAGWQVEMPDLEARVEAPEGAADFACLPTDTGTPDCTYTIGVTSTIDMQMATTYGYLVTLKPADRSDSASDISIGLQTMTLASEMSLREWIKISNQHGLKNYGYDWENYEPELNPFPLEDLPNVDEIWMDLAKDSQQANATIYMSIDKLIYAVRFRPNAPALQEIAEKFVSSLEFDLAKQQELAALPFYSADIMDLQPFLDEPIPTPSDEATQTPSSMHSPLQTP